MAYRGAKPIKWGSFTGMCTDVDPTELSASLASDVQNVDFDGLAASLRKGTVPYGAAVSTGVRTWGCGAYYPPTGDRSVIVAGNGNVYADANRDGSFTGESILSGLTDGVPVDLFQRQDNLFIGTHGEGLYYWPGTGAAAAASPPTAPATAPQLTVLTQTLCAFEADFTGSVGSITGAKVNTSSTPAAPPPVAGTYSVRLAASAAAAEGAYIYFAFAGNANLKAYNYIEIYVWCNVSGPSFRVAFYKAGDTVGSTVPDWASFPAFRVDGDSTKKWFRIRVPLHALTSDDLAAVPGMAIQFVGAGGRGYSNPVRIYFDEARYGSYLDPDTYSYYYTTDEEHGLGESPPSPVGKVEVPKDSATYAVRVQIPASLGSGIGAVRLYRYRDAGNFRLPRFIHRFSYTNIAALLYDDLSDGQLAINAAQGGAPELDLGRTTPPKATTYALVNNRILAGNVTVSGTDYPYRVWVSYYGNPYGWSNTEDPNDPLSAGWFDLPEKDPIVRIVEHQGGALIFTNRSVWSLSGSGFADFNLVKRGPYGLLAREAVVEAEALTYFLSADGVRVLAPRIHNRQLIYDSYLISEPIASRIAAMTTAQIGTCALGVDERRRVIVSVGANAYIFDPSMPGALKPGVQPERPGWSYHTGLGGPCYTQLRRGGSGTGYVDAGQVLVGSGSSVRLTVLFNSILNVALTTDNGTAITWFWTSAAALADTAMWIVAEAVTGMFLAAASQSVTAALLDETNTSVGSGTLSLGSGTTGYVTPYPPARYGPETRGRSLRLKLSGAHSVAMSIRQAVLERLQR